LSGDRNPPKEGESLTPNPSPKERGDHPDGEILINPYNPKRIIQRTIKNPYKSL